MVFPALFAHLEPGTTSPLSLYLVMIFSMILHRWKRLMLVILGLALVGLLSVYFFR